MVTPIISQIHFQPVRPREGLLGFASFVIDDLYAIGGVGVHARMNRSGIRLVYPVKKLIDGTSIALFYPLSKDVGDKIEDAVLQDLQRKGFGGQL